MLDIFAEHSVGGVIGLLFTALCADSNITSLDGVTTSTKGGFLNCNWKQLYIQIMYTTTAATYTYTISTLICKGLDLLPGLQLRCMEEEELEGMDAVEVSDSLSTNMLLILCIGPSDRLENLPMTICRSFRVCDSYFVVIK